MITFKRCRGRGVSLLIPFRDDDGTRAADFNWLVKYWKAHLPAAQIVIGHNTDLPFSKTKAFNDARSRATGDILMLVDADCYLDAKTVLHCAREIRRERKKHRRLWYIPYRHFYRLTEQATTHVLASDPAHPLTFPSPPNPNDTDNEPESASHGHWWGALVQIMPAEAFDLVGGPDTRFAGWGHEDVVFMRALDTLYAKHKTTPNQVLHLWHPVIEVSIYHKLWRGQISSSDNNHLADRYYSAFGDPRKMRRLVNEYQDGESPAEDVEAHEGWARKMKK